MQTPDNLPAGFQDILDFPLLSALLGRRSRRFFLGAEIPDGCFAYKSKKAPLPLSELEKMILLTAVGGSTAWHHMIYRAARYAPYLSNYAGAAGGRTFPSAAGFHTSEIFFTDDEGIYLFSTRDAPALAARDDEGSLDIKTLLEAHKGRIKKLAEGRMRLPEAAFEAHNTWVANGPGSFLIIPVADLAQHHLLGLCYLVQNGFGIYDDQEKKPIPGLERFGDLIDLDNPWPLTFFEQLLMNEATVELATACYAGVLMLQAMGLGGWMYDGLNPFMVLGATGDPQAPGLGFRYDEREEWAVPNVTGLPGVFEGFCPPHYPDMRAAVEAVVQRKFGKGGPFHPDTPGPWKDSRKVRASAQVHDERFKECVTLMAQYTLEKYGKFPGTIPSMHCLMYLQAHHLDLDFYDTFYAPGAYLPTHKHHMERWHKEG